MHESSFLKVQYFVENYVEFNSGPPLKVLDVGSMTVLSDAPSYKHLFQDKGVQYIGLDISQGLNVDYVPEDPYSWSEIPDETIDVIVSGQAFEHIPYFWITIAEMSRVLKPNGLLCLVFPSAGAVHRHPFDCWRFYPDSAQALTQYAGLELVEADTESSGFRKRVRTDWKETFVIARKTSAHDKSTATRLRSIVASRPTSNFVCHRVVEGPAVSQYEKAVRISILVYGLKKIKRKIIALWKHRIIPIAREFVKKLIRYDQRKKQKVSNF